MPAQRLTILPDFGVRTGVTGPATHQGTPHRFEDRAYGERVMLRWEPEPSLENAERAFSGTLCIGMIGPLSHAPGSWWYTLDGVATNRVARCDGHVAGADKARAEVEKGWSRWCDAAALSPR